MANPGSRKRTIQRSVFKKRPCFEMWIWCTILLCLIRLPCILTRCYPEGQKNLQFGKPLELFCIADNVTDPDYNPDNLKFLLNSTVVKDTELVNRTTRRLFIKNPEKAVKTYHCRNVKEKCVIRTVVDSPPMDVTDFRCVSYNLKYLRCNWTVPPNLSVIRYLLSVKFNGRTIGPSEAESKDRVAHWIWGDTDRNLTYRQQEETFVITLNGTNLFGSNIQHFTIDHFAVVKPDPPSNLQVLANKSHQVQLRWDIPNTMVDLLSCGVEHRIEYQIAKVDHNTYFRSVNATMLPRNNKTYTFWLKNLPYAHMRYDVRIYIKSKRAHSEEFLSNFTYIVFTTASERPKRPPETIAGAFSETHDYTVTGALSDNRKVLLYWKQLEEYEEGGANFTYMVNITQNNKTVTKYPYKNTSMSYVILSDVPWGPMQVSVASVNEKGSSVNSSYLYVPARTDNSLRVTMFSQIAYDGNMYKLSWVGKENIDNYTLFWCQHNVTNICNGRLNFTVLQPTRNNHEIKLPRGDRYQFAISANKGIETSGIVWATCDISNDTLLMYGFPVKVEKEGFQGKTYVNIKWSLTCSLHLEANETTIKGYNITYCVVLNTSSECDPVYDKKEIHIPNPRQMQKNITGLLPYKTYLFTLKLETIHGWRNLENAATETTTLEDTPTSPRNVTISDVKHDSMLISFDPPDPRNGIIGNYKIYNFSTLYKTVEVLEDNTDVYRRNVTLRNLNGCTEYGWTVIACNTGLNSCSEPSPDEPIIIKTKIGPPSKLKAPQIFQKPDRVIWEIPEILGGNDTFYEIRLIKDGNENGAKIYTPINDTALKIPQCVDIPVAEKYQVRAVNRDGDKLLAGEWSDPSSNTCKFNDNITMVPVFVSLFTLIAIGYGFLKLYNKYKKMDIKPVMPDGLCLPEPEKYTFGWNTSLKDNKLLADETLPLTTKNVVSSSEVKQKDNSNCGSSDHTDSTALSDTSRGPIDRHPSTSDDDSNSSLNLEVDAAKAHNSILAQDEEYSFSNSDNQSFRDPFNDKPFKAILAPSVNPTTGYVQSVPIPLKSVPMKVPSETASSSYVKAGLSPSIFTTGVAPPAVRSHPPTSSGYVAREDAHANSLINLPNLRPPLSTQYGPDSLPTMPTLPQPTKHGADSSYIQLQSLDSLPSLKPADPNIVPSLKPAAPSISPGDAVINKHLTNMLSAGHMADEPAILDPKMSPDAYCRFSWSTDPANDNLQSLYSPNINSFKN